MMTRRLAWAALAVALAAGCGKKEEAPPPTRPATVAATATAQLASWSVLKARELGSVACTLAPSQSALFRYLETAAASGGGAATAVATSLGLTPVRHSSGSYIFTGSRGYVSNTLGVAGFGPALVKVAVVTAVAAVVLEFVCVNTNHPAFVERLDTTARDFYHRLAASATRTALQATIRFGPPLHEARKIVIREAAGAFDQAAGATVELTGAVLRQLN